MSEGQGVEGHKCPDILERVVVEWIAVKTDVAPRG